MVSCSTVSLILSKNYVNWATDSSVFSGLTETKCAVISLCPVRDLLMVTDAY